MRARPRAIASRATFGTPSVPKLSDQRIELASESSHSSSEDEALMLRGKSVDG
jgi:hypothetical protein